MTQIEWAPITALKGYGMLIEGKKIGFYNTTSMKIHGVDQKWGVAYLLITEQEWDILKVPAVLTKSPRPITYAGGMHPEVATISKPFLKEWQQLFPNEIPFYLGTSTRWGQEDVGYLDLQTQILDLYKWVKSACES